MDISWYMFTNILHRMVSMQQQIVYQPIGLLVNQKQDNWVIINNQHHSEELINQDGRNCQVSNNSGFGKVNF